MLEVKQYYLFVLSVFFVCAFSGCLCVSVPMRCAPWACRGMQEERHVSRGSFSKTRDSPSTKGLVSTKLFWKMLSTCLRVRGGSAGERCSLHSPLFSGHARFQTRVLPPHVCACKAGQMWTQMTISYCRSLPHVQYENLECVAFIGQLMPFAYSSRSDDDEEEDSDREKSRSDVKDLAQLAEESEEAEEEWQEAARLGMRLMLFGMHVQHATLLARLKREKEGRSL